MTAGRGRDGPTGSEFSAYRKEKDATRFRRSLRKYETEIQERDLRVFVLVERGSSILEDSLLDPGTAGDPRRSSEIQPLDSGVIVAGKDGGVKIRGAARTELPYIIDLIDTMPMWRR